jgi:hypothetical protein
MIIKYLRKVYFQDIQNLEIMIIIISINNLENDNKIKIFDSIYYIKFIYYINPEIDFIHKV